MNSRNKKHSYISRHSVKFSNSTKSGRTVLILLLRVVFSFANVAAAEMLKARNRHGGLQLFG